MRITAILATIALLLTGCVGYKLGYSTLHQDYHTFTVPFVDGDEYGDLTTQLVRQIAQQTGLRYRNEGGDLLLCLKVLDKRESNIGFRYDANGGGMVSDNLIPTEGRLELFVEVSLVDCHCSRVVLGPDIISARIDYDHDYYSNLGGVNLFSLGQLNDIDIAQNAAMQPLHRQLAKNVADYIVNGWTIGAEEGG